MTQVQLASASKTTLLNYISELKETETKIREENVRLANNANYFFHVLVQIEKILAESPFVNDGKFLKKLHWVLMNLSSLRKVIESILNLIKEWRSQLVPIPQQNPA